MRIAAALLPVLTLLIVSPALASTEDDIAAVRSVSGVEATTPEVQAAWRRLADGRPDALPKLLAAMKGADPVAQNWLRAAVDAVAENSVGEGGLPADGLTEFLQDTDNAPRARRTAFEWIVKVDPGSKQRLLTAMLDDPSLELRYDAVAQLINRAEALGDEQAGEKRELYRQALTATRDPQQAEDCAEQLKELGEEIDLPGVMGFLKDWSVIGPFDNTQMKQFDTAYPPEAEQDLSAEHDGKLGKVEWKEVTAKAEGGWIDFIGPLGKEKEAVAYAYTTFNAKQARNAEVRYQSKNATKVWLNGELIATNEVYHSGSAFDQYRAEVQLEQGENTLLVKACQNEQKQPWEREWEFRLRVVDELGTPVGFQDSALVSQQ